MSDFFYLLHSPSLVVSIPHEVKLESARVINYYADQFQIEYIPENVVYNDAGETLVTVEGDLNVEL